MLDRPKTRLGTVIVGWKNWNVLSELGLALVSRTSSHDISEYWACFRVPFLADCPAKFPKFLRVTVPPTDHTFGIFSLEARSASLPLSLVARMTHVARPPELHWSDSALRTLIQTLTRIGGDANTTSDWFGQRGETSMIIRLYLLGQLETIRS